MPTKSDDVKVGHCYATQNDQYRRVTEISDGKVTYESWGGKAGYQRGSLSRNTASLDTFLAAIKKEIECDSRLPPLP